MRKVLMVLLFSLLPFVLIGQDTQRTLNVPFVSDVIQVDGILDEKVWESVQATENFWQFFPSDSVRAEMDTEIKMVYNESTIYVGIRAEVPADNYVVSSLRRDFSGVGNDNITLMFDTFSNGSNAYMFGVTPYGVQRDVLISGGGSSGADMNNAWDVTWRAETQRFDEHYVVEIAIPFSSLKFREGGQSWRFQAYRFDWQSSEQSAWNRIPQNQLLINLAFTGELIFEEPLDDANTPVAIIPYVNGLSEKDFEEGEASNSFDIGGDAKVAIGQSMNLDLTVNPDFSDVEVDDIITNLTRFEVFREERRQFFLDNSDLFGSFGSSRDDVPFFSRRVGIARDTTGQFIQNRILGGARLSGNLNDDWSLGVLNIQTDENPEQEIASNNNMMVALERRVFSRSRVGVFFLNRQSFKDYDFQRPEDKFNRVLGLDFNLASADNVWTGTFYLHKSFQPDDFSGNYSAQTLLSYNQRRFEVTSDFVYVDQEYRSDLGFIPRRDVFKSGKSATLRFFPDMDILSENNFEFLALHFWRPSLDYKLTDHQYQLSWAGEFRNQASIEAEVANQYIFLTNPFDPTRSRNGVPLPGDKGYYFNEASVQFQSDRTNYFTFDLESTVGQFFNGHRYSIGGQASVRWQPWASISMAVNYDRIRLPNPHPDADLWLLSPEIDITFSRSVFWSTLVQYSNQQNNLGLNSRLQWRFAPLSDLYLVYNDNYISNSLTPTYRSINLKVSYWFNL